MEIGDKDSSILSDEDMARSVGSKNEKEFRTCGFKERTLLNLLTFFDIMTIVRIPAILISHFLNTRGLRCYYKYRVLTFFAFLFAWVVSFVFMCVKNVREEMQSGWIILTGVCGGFFFVVDY